METAIEALAGKIEGAAPYLAGCLRDAGGAGGQAACLEALGKSFGGDATPGALAALAWDAVDAGELKKVEAEVRQRLGEAKNLSDDGGDPARRDDPAQPAPPQTGKKPQNGEQTEQEKTEPWPPQRSDVELLEARDLSGLRKTAYILKCVLSGAIILGFFGIIVMFFLGKEPVAGTKEQFGLLVGALIAAFTSVVQYYFGSSAGSAEKTIMMQSKPRAPADPGQPGKQGQTR